MKFTAKRLLAAGAIGISAIVTPVSLSVALSGVSSAPSSVAGAQGPFDEILFNQTTSTPPDTFVFQTAAGKQSPPQTADISGGCPTPPGPPTSAILSVCGFVYGSYNYDLSGGPPKAASLGTSGTATGVGAVSPAYSIENKTSGNKTLAEAIDFSPGGDPSIGSHRVFTGAQIPIQRKDSGVSNSNQSLTVQLAEYSSFTPSLGTLLGLQNCVIPAGTSTQTGTQITADPNDTTGVCNPTATPAGSTKVPSTFQTIEVRNFQNSTSISVVGPQAVFDLGTQICGGQQINTPPANDTVDNPGGVTATLTLTGDSSQCKTYTSFTSVPNPNNTNLPTLSFNGLSTGVVQFTVQVTWPVVPLCSPYVDAPPGNPDTRLGESTGIIDEPGVVGGQPGVIGGPAPDMCAVHSFQFNNTPFYDQGYCQSAQLPGGVNPDKTATEPQQELCTVIKSYNNDTVKLINSTGQQSACPVGPPCIPMTTPILTDDGKPGTQIVETWVGQVDYNLR